MGQNNSEGVPFRTQYETIENLIKTLDTLSDQKSIEKQLKETFKNVPDTVLPDSDHYYSILNTHLYRNIVKLYKDKESKICVWRFFKKLSPDQLSLDYGHDDNLKMMDNLIRTFFYSDPLDDLTCIFIPINDNTLITQYLDWIRSYFYDVNYPTSLLWLYALDSTLSSFFPDEIIYIGKRIDSPLENIMIPDFSYKDAVMMKRFTARTSHFDLLEGADANNEFEQIFSFLKQEYEDRCLSHSGKQGDYISKDEYNQEWEKFEEVLGFGVSAENESGCISFSDLRNSTTFLNKYGKNMFRNVIQQPFFEKTKLISKIYNGRIDKFMGDNVMCVFLSRKRTDKNKKETDIEAIISNFFALFELCKVLLELMKENNLVDTELGLRSGISYGTEILRSNLGNEIVRDFTVTGETVNLAARLEHFSIHELIIHNKSYFADDIQRFPDVSQLAEIGAGEHFNPMTKEIIKNYTIYQNIISNLERLDRARFDIRFNHGFYSLLSDHIKKKGYKLLNPDTADVYGYEEYNIEGFNIQFYFSYYNPKGFDRYEKIWILPIDIETLESLNISVLK